MPNDTKRPVAKKASKAAFAGEVWRPFETRRQEVDRLFEGFGEVVAAADSAARSIRASMAEEIRRQPGRRRRRKRPGRRVHGRNA